MATIVSMYAVPDAIASELRLTAIRRSDGKGFYLLSSSDLRPYGIGRALGEGAVPLTADEAKHRFNTHEPNIQNPNL